MKGSAVRIRASASEKDLQIDPFFIIDTEAVTHVRLLSGPANLNERAMRRFEAFKTELAAAGTIAEWHVLPADVARDIHARVIFDADAAWELPPLNSLLKGTVDSIRPSEMPRDAFEEAWSRADATPLAELRVAPVAS
jgi:hypothetical protein